MVEPSPDGGRLTDANIVGLLHSAQCADAREAGRSDWSPPRPSEVGRMLPQYDVASLIGSGGMGAVYKGVQKSLKRPVAIKIVPPELEDEEVRFVDRFKREVQAMATLSHPGIVTLYDAGATREGLLYLVMEFVEGTDLQRLIARQGRLPSATVRSIMVQVCEALEFAHRHSIVHRDVKPSNVIVNDQGRIKVVDFGLAKIIAQDGSFTQTSLAIGTPEFIAPEAALGAKDVDHRADIYAIGVMLYLALTGCLPRGKFDPPSKLVPGLDPGLDAVVARAMQSDPALRYASLRELLDDLEASSF